MGVTTDTDKWLERLKSSFPDLSTLPPAAPEVVEQAEEFVGPLPPELRELLRCSNGLVCAPLRVLSALDPQRPKKTWESLQRANDAATADALGGDAQLLARFLVIAHIGDGYVLWDRTDGTLWHDLDDEDDVQQTTLGFREFIERAVREYSE